MIKRYRKFETLLGAMRRLIEEPESAGNYYDLSALACQLSGFEEELAIEPAKVRLLLDLATVLRASDIRGRQMAEERILGFLGYLSGLCRSRPGDGEQPDDLNLSGSEPQSAPAPCAEVLRELHDFALGCFSFKRSRDAFGGKRRAAAFELLTAGGPAEDCAEAVALAMRAIRKGRGIEARAAVEFIKEHLAATDEEPDESLIDAIEVFAERADSESGVFVCLDTLVEWGVISEFEAMERLDDWRTEHYER